MDACQARSKAIRTFRILFNNIKPTGMRNRVADLGMVRIANLARLRPIVNQHQTEQYRFNNKVPEESFVFHRSARKFQPPIVAPEALWIPARLRDFTE
jgi:hypothetical protein